MIQKFQVMLQQALKNSQKESSVLQLPDRKLTSASDELVLRKVYTPDLKALRKKKRHYLFLPGTCSQNFTKGPIGPVVHDRPLIYLGHAVTTKITYNNIYDDNIGDFLPFYGGCEGNTAKMYGRLFAVHPHQMMFFDQFYQNTVLTDRALEAIILLDHKKTEVASSSCTLFRHAYMYTGKQETLRTLRRVIKQVPTNKEGHRVHSNITST